jgi:glycosyltransferase involved in cell wall biosynthesis
MAKKPFFSVIIPALNEARYLPKLLGDLASQTYQDFEVIVVDGGSKDKTLTLAQEYVSRLPKLTLLTSPRAHVCTQRNLGAKHARANVLIFSDADNRLPPYFLQGVKYRWESEKVEILSFWVKPDISNPRNDAITSAINLFMELQLNVKPTYLLEGLITINRLVFESIGGFNERVNYAEGKPLIQQAILRGYRARSVRDPQYIFSLRRFRKYGILSITSRVAKMELSNLLGPDFHAKQVQKLYPMLGGTLFNKTQKSKNKFIRNIQKILKEF